MFSSVLVVCVGNICRSPMAEGIARGVFPKARVSSAGLGALVGRPAEPFSVELMRERGIDISAHRARQITPEMIRDAELILAMEAWQVREIEQVSGAARGRTFRLGHWGDFDIADCYQEPREAFEHALVEIERGLGDLRKALKL